MYDTRSLQIANRIHLLLLRELGQGIEIKRLLAEPLYARDVLLVCDALAGTDLAELARHFRIATAQAAADPGGLSTLGAESSSFGHSRPPSEADAVPPGPHPGERSWFSPSRWLGL